MGDDPHLPDEMTAARASHNSSAATGGSVTEHHYGLTKGQSFVIVSVAFMALGLAVSAVILSAMSAVVSGREVGKISKDVERESERVSREMARSEQESRMLQYYVLEMDAKLVAAGFKTDAESIAKKLKENGK